MYQKKAHKLPPLKALAIAVHAACGVSAWALPQNATVVNGQVAITQPSAGAMQINASNGAIINWKQFSIGAGEVTRFVQPSATSAVLNRVTGPDVSQLLGQLKANGQVFLINPNGIVVGGGARIDTNSFVASTLDIADSDFLAGKLRFAAGANAGRITNDGMITAGPGGRIALIAPNIENSGIIRADGGAILLAAGRKIEIASLDMEGVTFEIQAPTDSVLNLGKLLAENGAVRAFAGTIRHSGEIRANRMVQQADGSIVLAGSSDVTLTSESTTNADGVQGGSVLVQSRQGTTRVAGNVSATGTQGKGGDIELLGQRVALESPARVDASGAAGGGRILVGGDFQGANAHVQNAERVFVGAGAELRADATEQGDGGRVIVWADENTRFRGGISAHGGAQGGNGGFAEVSGKGNLEFAGTADLSASQGSSGTLLLDPLDIIISSVSGILPIVVDEFAEFPDNVVTVAPDALAAVAGNVVLQAGRDIYINDAIALTTPGAGLTATAGGASFSGGYIRNNAGISTVGGAVTLRGLSILGSGGINTSGGAVDVLTYSSLSGGGSIITSGGAITLGSQFSTVSSISADAGSGSITVTGSGISSSSFSTTGNASLTASSGSITGTSIVADTVSLTANGQINTTVNAASRVNASSSGSQTRLTSASGQALRLGTVSGATGVYLNSSGGIVQTAGGLVTAPLVEINALGSASTAGTGGAPLLLNTSSLLVTGMAAPSSIALSNNTLSKLDLSGTVAGLGGTTVTGAANLSSLSLSAGSGVVNASAASSGGFASGFNLRVTNGGLNATSLTLPGGAVTLEAQGPLTVGSVASGQLSVLGHGVVDVGTATTTGNGGINITSSQCDYYSPCALASPITVGTLTAGGSGSISLSNVYDNGAIAATSLTAGGSIAVNAGQHYYSFYPRTSSITVGSASAGTSLALRNYGTGNVVATGALGAANGSVILAASDGSVTANGAGTTATQSVSVTATNGAAALGTVVSSNSGIAIQASTGVSFGSLTANGTSGNVSVQTTQGSIVTTQDNTAYDVAATGTVLLSAPGSGSIGNAGLVNPMDIRAGAGQTVTLAGGLGIGAVGGHTVNVNGTGLLDVTTASGQFHIKAQDDLGAATTLTGIRLAASAAGMGNAGTSSLIAQNMTVNASSDGSTITIGDVQQASGTLNQFRFNSMGGGLTFGDVSLTTAGFNELWLQSSGPLTQVSPGTNNISAGFITLAAGVGNVLTGGVTSSSAGPNSVGNRVTITGNDITTGNIAGPAVFVTGNNLSLGSVQSTGTNRGYPPYVFVPRLGYSDSVVDELRLTAAGALATSGNVSSATKLALSGASIAIGGGTGSVAGGHASGNFDDFVEVNAGPGTFAAGAITGYRGRVLGNTINTSTMLFDRDLEVGNAATNSITTGNLTGSTGLSVRGASLNTGNLAAGSGTLTVTVEAGNPYAPVGKALSGSTVVINASEIDLVSGSSTVTAPTVRLNSDAGGVQAALTGTTNLSINTSGVFDVTSSGTLTSLTVEAYGDVAGAGAGSSVSANGGAQTLTLLESGGTLSADFKSPSGLGFSYTEYATGLSSVVVATTGSLGAGSSLTVNTENTAAALTASSVNLAGSGAVDLYGGGNVSLVSVHTGGGSVTASTSGSSGSNVSVEEVVTLGGSVTLSADTGNIVRAGGQPLQIDMRTGGGAASGTLTLYAGGGNVGSAGSRLQTAGAQSLAVTGDDDIAIDLTATPLTNLAITTSATGSGAVSIVNSNYGSLGVSRVGSDLVLTGVAPGVAGSFGLTATDGNIRVADDITNVTALSLNAGRGYNSTGDLIIQAGSGARQIDTNSFNLQAGHDVLIGAGGGSGDNVTVTANGSALTSSIQAGHDVRVTANGGTALVQQLGSSSALNLNATNQLAILGGSAGVAGATAFVTSTGSQGLTAGNLLIQGGSTTGAAAKAEALGSQSGSLGGASILGGGDAASASLVAGADQNFTNLFGTLTVQGGSGAGATARMESLGGPQYVGDGTFATNTQITVRGGTGSGATAAIRSSGVQQVYSDGDIRVFGGSGTGANAEILSAAGSQNIGSIYTYYSGVTTHDVVVQGGAGGTARIQAAGNQSVLVGNDVYVLGGTGANTTASIETTAGTQAIGYTYLYDYQYSDQSRSVLVQGGSANGASAWIKGTGTQTVDGGGTIRVLGGTAGTSAEIFTSGGTQTIGNSNSSYDQTDSITLTGGTGAGAYAKIATNGTQTVRSLGTIALNGGSGNGAGAVLVATTGQTVASLASVNLTGGSGSSPGANETAIRNLSSGNQTVSASGNISLASGGFGSDTWIKQDGASSQSISASGNISLVAATANTGVTSIESQAGGQTVFAGGSLSIDNQAGWITYIASGGTQTVTADTLSVSLSSENVTGPTASLTAGGNQTITLHGDSVTPGSATLSVVNLSSQANSVASIVATGNQTIAMDYASAGQLKIGDVAGEGLAKISAGVNQTIVAGSLLMQGGQTVASDAKLLAAQVNPQVGKMTISTLYGPVEMLGGLNGGAYIDPPELDMVSNGAVLLQAGTNSTANVNINAGIFNLAATAGPLDLINSSSSSATATITAGTFNYNVSGPRPSEDPSAGALSSVPGILALLDLATGGYGLDFDENGNLIVSRRRLNQCY